ncbi:immunity 22 family protein [Priestia endophytica]|uniref:immunity 22 family protein n=1 Tax=Priestia endophytica TaxID=135735 RepID=UPI0022828DCC|nr:immunity 22 family protein [Priestia endophytica]MCY8233437.1 immunity 22 family protein [Priestia endophytica]
MEKQGSISIWLGNLKGERDLEEYVALKYNEDGDSIPSPFFRGFHINQYETDEDFFEVEWLGESSKDISKLLEGISYEEVIIPKVKKYSELKKTYNSIILIYHFAYSGEVHSSGKFDFILCTNYN